MKKTQKIKKEDFVQVIAGNDKGMQGRVLDVNDKTNRILVEGVNIRTKHEKPNPQNQKGGRVKKEMPVHYSNVMILDDEKNPTRIGIKRVDENGKMVPKRYAKSNGKNL